MSGNTVTVPQGGADAFRKRVLEDMREELVSLVKEELITVDQAVTETKEKQALLDAWVDKVDAKLSKVQLPGVVEDKYNLGRAVAGVMGGSAANLERTCPLEYEASQQLAQSVGSDSGGGFLVPGEVRDDLFIELVRPRSVLATMGAVQENFSTSPIEIPRETLPVAEPTSKGENVTLDSKDVKFGMMRLEPFLHGLIVKGSRRFFAMGAQAEPRIRRILGREMAIKIDDLGINGTGAEEPIGVVNQLGVNSVDFSDPGATDFSVYSDLQKMKGAPLEGANNHDIPERPGWIIESKAVRAFDLIKSESDDGSSGFAQLVRKVISDAPLTRILGDPFASTNHLLSNATAPTLLYGDWPLITIAFFGPMILETTTQGGAAFEDHQLWLKGVIEMDIGNEQPTAFSKSKNYDLTGF